VRTQPRIFWTSSRLSTTGSFFLLGRTEQFEQVPVALEGVLEDEFDPAQGDGGGVAGDLFSRVGNRK